MVATIRGVSSFQIRVTASGGLGTPSPETLPGGMIPLRLRLPSPRPYSASTWSVMSLYTASSFSLNASGPQSILTVRYSGPCPPSPSSGNAA